MAVSFSMITLLSVGIFLLALLAASELGRRLGAAQPQQDPDGLAKGIGAAEAAVFGLLGLLLAFTFSGAASRFEERRQLVTIEANAIGTAWLRIDLLPADAQPQMRDLFRSYLDGRLDTYHHGEDLGAARTSLAEDESLQGRIWRLAVVETLKPGVPTQAGMLLLPALNDMIDITTTRLMATRDHPPAVVFLMLAVLSLVGSLLVGYGISANRRRSWLHTIVFAGILTVTTYVIVDLEFPRLGLIRVDSADQVLVELRASMR
jgi:hypothetical protein